MGGKALKNTFTERKIKSDYERIKNKIITILSNYIICKSAIELPEKTDFGDLDIIYINDINSSIKELIIKLFSPNEIVTNGDVISFDYEKFQIDLIKCSKESYDMYDFYLSYGDLGSIIGRIANYYGLKFGHAGLWLNLLENTTNPDININCKTTMAKLELTKDPKQICEFLDFNYNKWKEGFSTKKEIMEFLINSKYFKKDIFYTLNYDHRDRAKLRPFYRDFMDFIGIDINQIEKASHTNSEIGINLQKEAIEYFNKEKTLSKILNEIKQKKERKNKLNGKHLLDLGIDPKKINEIMSNFKTYIKETYKMEYDNWLDNNPYEMVINHIKNFK